MNCSACGNENPDGAKFCNQCAKPLPLRCLKCGTSNPISSKFCNECAAPLTTASQSSTARAAEQTHSQIHIKPEQLNLSSAADGERKMVTALFADIKGSMELMEDLDPEDARRASLIHHLGSPGRPRAPRSEDGEVLEIPQGVVTAAAGSAGNDLNPNRKDKNEDLRLGPTSVASEAGQSVSAIARPFGTAREYEKAKDRTPKQTCIAAPWWATFHIAHCIPLAPSR